MSLRIHRRPVAGFVEPCLPTPAKILPAGPRWVYEIKHDGYRLLVRKNGDQVRVYTRSGKLRLEQLLARPGDGIAFNEHLMADGSRVFEHACRMGLEGIVCKRVDLPYRSGRAKCWIKVKNPQSPAALRVWDESWSSNLISSALGAGVGTWQLIETSCAEWRTA